MNRALLPRLIGLSQANAGLVKAVGISIRPGWKLAGAVGRWRKPPYHHFIREPPVSDTRLVKITYWKGHAEFNVWWFADQVEKAMKALDADRWLVPSPRRGCSE